MIMIIDLSYTHSNARIVFGPERRDGRWDRWTIINPQKCGKWTSNIEYTKNMLDMDVYLPYYVESTLKNMLINIQYGF